MGTGYTRNDTGNNIADGNVINASDLDGEFDAVEAAFNASTGHTHDGTSAEGAPIEVVGPAQDLVITATEVRPKTDNTLDLGTGSFEFKDLYLDGTANIDSLVADTADINAGTIDGVTLGTNSAVTEAQVDNININGNAITSTDTNGDITISPDGTGTVVIDTDLDVDNININGNTISSIDTNGNIALTPDGTGEVDISKVDIDSGTIDDTTIGGSTPAAGTFTTGDFNTSLNVDGTVTADDLILSDANPTVTMFETDATDLNTNMVGVAGALYIQTANDAASALTNRIKVDHATGDISFYEDTGTTPKLFWDASAESLGIGTSSPSNTLHLSDASVGGISGANPSGGTSRVENSPSVGSGGFVLQRLFLNKASTANDGATQSFEGLAVGGDRYALANIGGYIDNAGTGNAVSGSFRISTKPSNGSITERMRIDSSGNVGIGTSSPENVSAVPDLTVAGKFFTSDGTSANPAQSFISDQNTGMFRAGADTLAFTTGGSEAARIDSSGNLLVGTTDNNVGNNSGSSNSGFNVTSSGEIKIASTSASVFNKLDTDGNMIDFKKDGSTVGSIGVASSAIHIGNQDTGIRFAGGTDIIQPWNTGTNAVRDNAIDLGSSSARFKDLYLSGGVYLGGTTSANYIEDYEEGTWTPVDGSGASLSFTVNDATYTKIGRVVHCHAQVLYPSTASATQAQIGGLPFTNIVGNNANHGAFTVYTSIDGVYWVNTSGGSGSLAHNSAGSGVSNATVSGKQFRLVWVYTQN